MTKDTSDLTALLGSRICHDLISPLGAIGNGVELLMMSGDAAGPEIALIAQSVTNANAKIRFFRIAFGHCSADQRVAQSEVRSVLDDMTRGGRLSIEWLCEGDPLRSDVKIAFLAVQCFETALPYGGRITIEEIDGRWHLQARAEKMLITPEIWSRLRGEPCTKDVSPAHVQFALLPLELQRQSRRATLELTDTKIAFSY
ncbi:MAG: histidine phosphotransferase family protein [Albidovulum sp.]